MLILLLACSASTVSAADLSAAVASFDDGNSRFRMGDYEGAVASYRQAADQGYVSGALFYNMGNAYYRLDQIGEAIRFYEKARRLTPDNAELLHNLEIAREQTVDRFSQLPEPFWKAWWRRVVSIAGATGLFAAGMVFYMLASVALALRIRTGRTPWRRRVFSLAAAAAVFFLGLGFIASFEQAHQTEAVVLLDEVTLLQEPDGPRSDLSVHEGLIVDIVSSSGSWSEIRLPNGAAGWLRTDGLGRI